MAISKYRRLKVIGTFVVVIAAVIIFSSLFAQLWGGKEGKSREQEHLNIAAGMTIEEFGKTNNLSNDVLQKVFGDAGKEYLQKTIVQTGMPTEHILAKVQKEKALHDEFEAKNWFLIPLKFALWIIFLTTVFVIMKKGLITSRVRKILYFIAVAVFGVILGSDPNPMGTVKDAIVLWGTKGAVFPPRMIALTVFLIMVFLANRFICAWGCQLGALQDAVFRINRGGNDRQGILPQVKLPFAVTNTIRVITLVSLSIIVFTWAYDFIGAIDPFKIFKPSTVAVYGWVLIGFVLIASLFIYRPWCHLFCPFGLVAWIVGKASIFKIQVNYDTCIACEACVKACPSNVMEVILKRDRIIPDCFSCATCMEACPTKSISLRAGKRALPPADKYRKKRKE